jgi:uncharacterized protein YhdP
MIKKVLLNAVKVLKVSIWIGAIFSLLIALVVGFFLAFPNLLKAPIESQLTEATGLDIELSAIIFEFDEGGISLKIPDLIFDSIEKKQTFVRIKGLRWYMQLSNFFEDDYHLYQINIDSLTVDTTAKAKSSDFSVVDMEKLIIKEAPKIEYFIKSLTIEKTLIKGKQNFEIAPITIKHNQGQLVLNIVNQQVGKHQVDVSLELLNNKPYQAGLMKLSAVVGNEDFSLVSDLKLYQQNEQNYVEFTGFIEQINAVYLDDYLSVSIVGESANSWIKRGFKSGILEKINVHILKNLSAETPAEIDFNAHLADTELVFNSDWKPLKKFDANITTDGKNIKVLVNRATLYNQPLTNISLEVADLTNPNLDVHMLGNIDMDSAELMQFLANAPSGDTIHKAIKKFNLTGPLKGELDLIIPLDDRASTINVDLVAKNNKLIVLDSAIVIENYNSKIAFHNNQISTDGVGNINDMLFGIRINPDNGQDNTQTSFAVELINNDNNLELYLAYKLDEMWHAKIETATIKSNVEITLTDDLPKINVLNLQVETLDDEKNDWSIKPSDLPDMLLSVHNVLINKKEIPNFSVKLKSTDDILKITDLSFDGVGVDDYDLLFEGVWMDGKTSLMAKTKGKKLSNFLHKLKIEEKVKGGEFDLDLRLNCDCEPWNANFETLNGVIKMKVKEGVFTDEKLNISKVLLLLNIKLLTQFSIGDVTGNGFYYDNIDAQITLQDSIVKIDHFKLDSSSGEIYLSGTSNIVDETYDMQAQVIPAIGDTLPAATYLAGGGLVGLGIWLISQSFFEGELVDKIIGKVVEFKYKIIGPWNKPVIENVSKIL